MVFCDNRGSLGAVIRGSCVTAVGRALSSALWNFAAPHGLQVWIDRVDSELNCADAPSRMRPLLEKPVVEAGINLGVPAHFAHMMSSEGALMEDRLSACPAAATFTGPRHAPSVSQLGRLGI